MQRIIDKIKTNKIKCKKCGDIIESTSVHDFKWCSCETVAVDGGHEYLRRLGNEESFEDLSCVMKLVEIKTDGFKVIKNALYKKDDNRKCPNCNSDNITYDKSHSVAEFLILPNYRRNHIGKRVAFDVFNMLIGIQILKKHQLMLTNI